MTPEQTKALITEIVTASIAKFAADAKAERTAEDEKKGTAGKPSAMPAQPSDEPPKKPVEAKMASEDAAKMTALVNDNAMFKAKFDAMENEKKADGLMAKADKELARKIVTPEGRAHVAKFAAQNAAQKDGEAEFLKYVADLKPMLKDKPSVAGFDAASGGSDVSDPVVAKFAKDGADLAEVATFSSKWDEIKKLSGDHFRTSREEFIRNEIALASAERKGVFAESTRR